MMSLRMGMVVLAGWAAAACSGGDVPIEPDAPDTITRKLTLVNAPLERSAAVEALIAAAGISKAEAEALLDELPGTIATGLSHDEADGIADKLRAAGMTTQIRRD